MIGAMHNKSCLLRCKVTLHPMQATECEHRAEAAVLQLQALANHRDVLNNRLTELEDERRAELAPQIKVSGSHRQCS